MAIVITTTSDDKNELEMIAKKLIGDRLAACCQIIGPITSIYRWKDDIEQTTEWMCLIKTKEEQFENVEAAIKEIHHYDQPEIISTKIDKGSSGYLEWISVNSSGD
jgi:periplasmic divalent cation tolerance protein